METKIKLSVLCFMLCLLQPASGYPPGFTDSGECTSTTFWRVDALETGGLKLTIYGTGVTHAAHNGAGPEMFFNPYVEYAKNIVEIDVKEGITRIGSGNFAGMMRVRKISLPTSLEAIDFTAFYLSLASDCITVIPSAVTYIWPAVFEHSFTDAKNLPESSVELTDEEFIDLLYSYSWVDTIPLYFESIPSPAGMAYGNPPYGMFYCDERSPIYFYVHDSIMGLAAECPVFNECFHGTEVVPVAYTSIPGKYNATISWEYDEITKTLSITGYGEIKDEMTLSYLGYVSPNKPWWTPEVRDNCEHLIIGEGIMRLGRASFRDFTELKDVRLPSTLSYMYGTTFGNCSSLETVILPSNLSIIGYASFENCSKLRSLYIENVNPPACVPGFYLDDIALPWSNPGFTLYVPPHAIQNYWLAEYYSEHTTQIKPYITKDILARDIMIGDTVYTTVNDTTYIPVTVNDTVYEKITVYLTDTVWTTTTEYSIVFVPLEIETDIYPFPEETKMPFLQRLTSTTFQSFSPYDRETLYFYNIDGTLADKVTYLGGRTVQTSRQLQPTVIAVSDRGWYQVVR